MSFHIGREGVCTSTKDGSLGKEGNGSFQIGREESARTMDGTLVGGDLFWTLLVWLVGIKMCGREPFVTFVFFMSSTVQVSGSQLLDGLALQASDAILSLYFGKIFESQRCKRIGTEGVYIRGDCWL
jgi:hypothetical protein